MLRAVDTSPGTHIVFKKKKKKREERIIINNSLARSRNLEKKRSRLI